MSTMRTLTLGSLAALTLATAAGCGTTGLAPSMAGYAAPTGMINVMGVERKLGFNLALAARQARTARPAHLPRQGMLPSQVDNRQFCTPVADQGQLGSCTAFAMGKGLREYLMVKNGEAVTPMSALFLYYNERVVDGDVDQDAGSTSATGMAVLKQTGDAPDADWTYNIAQFAQKPPAQAFNDAANFKLTDETQLANLNDAKTAVAQGLPVVFGFTVYQSFMNIGADGMMPVPRKGEKVLGGHEVMIAGYDDAKQALLIRNSWGPNWGQSGYFYMPYKFFTASGMVDDIWTATR